MLFYTNLWYRIRNVLLESHFIDVKKMKLEIILEKEENYTFSVHCPALKGCHSQGKTREDAFKNMKEATQLYLEVTNKKAKRERRLHPESVIAEIAI